MKVGSKVRLIQDPEYAKGEILDEWFPERHKHDPAWMVHWEDIEGPNRGNRKWAHGVWHSSELLEVTDEDGAD